MKNRFLLFLCILLLSSFLFSGCTDNKKIELSNSLVEEAKELYSEREYKKAIEKYGEALNEYPANRGAYFGVVQILLQKGYGEEADDVASEAALRLKSKDAASLFVEVGDYYFSQADFKSAEEVYEKARNKNKSLPKVGISSARLYIQKRDIKKASKVLNDVRDKENAEFLLLKAYMSLDKWSEGSKLVNRIDLNDVEDKELKERVVNLREIYALEDGDELFKNVYLSKEYINAGYPYLAVILLNKQSDSIEEYWEGQYFLGKAYFDHGDLDKAIDKLNNAVLLDVDDVDMYLLLGRAYMMKGDNERALQNYKKAFNIIDLPDDSYVVKEYISVLIDNNMLNSARAVLSDLLDEDYSYPWIYLLFFDISYEQKSLIQMSEAIRSLYEIKDLTQGEEKALLRCELLYAMEDIKDVNEVKGLISQYKDFDQYNPEVYLFEAKFFLHQGGKTDAKEALYRAIELDLTNSITSEANRILATIK